MIGADLEVLKSSPTEVQVVVPATLLRQVGTYKVHMITGGREPEPSWNFVNVLVSYGRQFNERWNEQKMSIEF